MINASTIKPKKHHVAWPAKITVNAVAILALFGVHGNLLAQDAPVENEQATTSVESAPSSTQSSELQNQRPLGLRVASDGNVSNNEDILRLEETIRGNKEQPKVLSIVPWQLPLHQRIDRNEQRWAPTSIKLKSLERNSFLKEIKLIEGIQKRQSNAKVSAQNN